MQVAEEDETYEEASEIEMAFEFDLDLEEIAPRNTAQPVVSIKAADSQVLNNLIPEPTIKTAAESIDKTAVTIIQPIEEIEVNDALEIRKKELQDKLNKRVSKFSLQGIEARNNHNTQQKGPALKTDELPQESFTGPEVIDLWNEFKALLESKGSMNLASCMNLSCVSQINP
jgi:hypothetical protein